MMEAPTTSMAQVNRDVENIRIGLNDDMSVTVGRSCDICGYIRLYSEVKIGGLPSAVDLLVTLCKFFSVDIHVISD